MTRRMRAFRPDWAWTGSRLVRAPIVTVDEAGLVVPHRGEAVEDVPGLLLPGLINAHTHLELRAIPTPVRQGFVAWLPYVRQAGGDAETARATAATHVVEVRAAGARGVGEITNTGFSATAISASGLVGRVFHESFGIDRAVVPETTHRSVPHAPHTTHPAVIMRCAAMPGPWSIHFDEDPEEAKFLCDEGAWPEMMRAMGRDLSDYRFPHASPAAYLRDLGVLSPRALLVHATCTRGADLDIVAASGAHVCLCVRSNLHITGNLPDVSGMVARGIPLALGTDSRTSSPDLDILAEAAAARAAFPDVDVAVWMRALTVGGAEALDLPLGTLEAGARKEGRDAPGLLLVDVPGMHPLESLLDGTQWPRRWLA